MTLREMLLGSDHQNMSDFLDRTDVIPVPPVHADKWRNIIFDKAGNAYRGVLLHPSEEAARKLAHGTICECQSGRGTGFQTLDGPLLFTDFAFVLQMPVAE